MNGYFQLYYDERGTFITLYPPTEDGQPVAIGEILNYLQIKNIACEKNALYSALQNLKEKTLVQINPTKGMPEREMFLVDISDDKMKVTAKFYPPSNGGELMTKDEILNDLYHMRIMFGIDSQSIDRFLAKREYCTEILIAKGVEPVQGWDAKIEYYFNTDLRARPTLKEDGSVDFFHLNTMNACVVGDVIARLIPENKGEYGTTVLGERIKPKDVKKDILRFSHNIELSEDRTELKSLVNGHVSLIDNKVFVANVYEVKNVDNNTGNIEYEGDVIVVGTVCTNFSVKAGGNVEVRGVVEGAYIEAGGNITIARGMNGMGRGTLKAGGNIIAKYLENSTVNAGGYVEAEAILHCKVLAGTEVNVLSNKGLISGGSVCATNAVHAKIIGSTMAADTIIEIGIDPSIKERYTKLHAMINENKKSLETINPVLQATSQKLVKGVKLTPDQIKYFKQLVETSKEKQQQIEDGTKEIMEIQEIMASKAKAEVTVTGEVYAGTQIIISDASMIVNQTMKYCRFIKSQGDVKMTSI